jgi:hypothetical protein
MGLFKKKKAPEIKIDPLAILASGIDAAIAGATGEASVVMDIKPASAEDCRAAFTGETTAMPAVLAIHGPSSRPRAGIFFSAGSLSGAKGEIAPTAEAVGTAWTEKFPDATKGCYVYGMVPAKDRFDAAIWPFLELEAYRLTRGSGELWLFIEPALRTALSANPAETGSPATQPPTGREPVAVASASDFVALDMFVPRVVSADKYHIAAETESFRFVSGAQAMRELVFQQGQEPAFFQAGFALAPRQDAAQGTAPGKISLIYVFHKQSLRIQSPGETPDTMANAVATGMLQSTMRNVSALTRQAPATPGLKRLSALPELSGANSILIIRGVMSGPSFRMPFEIIAPAGTLLPVLQACVEGSAMKRLSAKMESLVLYMNARILSARLHEILAPKELREKIPQMLACELLNHLSDLDYDLVLQNCLIASLGAKNLPALFYYNEQETGADGVIHERVLQLRPLDTRRLFAHMPDKFRDDYVANAGQLQANPITLCVSKNIDVMKDIAKAISTGRIAASPRLVWLVKEFFLKGIRAKDIAELEQLKAKGIPFGALKDMKPTLAQRVMASLDDRDVALALLDAKEEKANIRKHISSARMTRLDEELSFLSKQYDSGELEPAELLRAKKLFADNCAEVIHKNSEDAQLSRASEPPRAEPGPARKDRPAPARPAKR